MAKAEPVDSLLDIIKIIIIVIAGALIIGAIIQAL